MMEAAHRGDIDVVVVWSLDRLGRSMTGNLQAVLDLDRCGVEVLSVRESWLDTGGPVRALLIAIGGLAAGRRGGARPETRWPSSPEGRPSPPPRPGEPCIVRNAPTRARGRASLARCHGGSGCGP
ncbi:MAG: recombinase family protein [Myxococcales bacterium]|nr:recombinase family protein [Myxococcales bacterium]